MLMRAEAIHEDDVRNGHELFHSASMRVGHNTTWTDFALAMWRARVLCLSTVEHTGLRQTDKLDRWLSVYVLLLTQQQLFIQPGEKLFAELGLEILQ